KFEQTFETGIRSGDYPDLRTPITKLNQELLVMLRKDHLARAIPAGDVAVFLSLVRRYSDLVSEVHNCREQMDRLNLSIMERSPFI
ncbi:MAG: hypothetical protein ACQKBW_08060, partial [Puniceicoccales bacterium]